jgi:hypothetical protein
MNLSNDKIFEQEMDKLNLTYDNFNYFSSIFGTDGTKNIDASKVDLRKAFLLQVAIARKATELDMSGNEISETLKDLCRCN